MVNMKVIEEIVETIENGNLTDARSTLAGLKKKEAIVATAYVVDHLHGLPNYSTFLRVLENLL